MTPLSRQSVARALGLPTVLLLLVFFFYPLVRIAITNGPTPDTLQKLRKNQIDFGAVSEPLPE